MITQLMLEEELLAAGLQAIFVNFHIINFQLGFLF
jgi:hypothetical protein